jgi:hypothetical protein
MLKMERMMPQYHDVRTGQGDIFEPGTMSGHDPVDVKTPARSADYMMRC